MHQEVARMLEENPLLEVADESASGIFTAEPRNTPSTANDEPGQTHSDSDDRGADDFGNEPADWNAGGGGRARSEDDEDEPHPDQAAEQASLRAPLHSQLTTSSLDDRDRKVVGLLIDALDENGYLAQNLEELAELLPAELGITLDDLETALGQLQHLDLPAAHDFAKIKKLLHCSDDELRAAQHLIVCLNPKPGAEFGQSIADYVVPDVIGEKYKNKR